MCIRDRPLKQLKGFTKSGLITGTPETVQVTIGAGDLWFWDDVNHKKVFPTGDWTIMAGPSSADADLKSVTLTVTGQRTAGVEVVSAQPDATELSLDTPDNRINAQLSVTKHDMAFWDLSDPALKVEYTSSKPSVATVDAKGAVAPVSTGTALITAKATANGQSKSTTFPVVVTSGPPDATGSAFPNTHTSLVNFGDTKVVLDQASSGTQLSASLFPAASVATYSYQIAPMDTNTAEASVTSAGVLTASKIGHVRVTVTATASGVKTSESALIRIAPLVTVTPATASVLLGNTQQFSADVVTGGVDVDGSVTWSLEGATSAATTLSADGLLTVGLDEAINSVLTVKATSVYDPTESGSAAVTVVPGTAPSVTKVRLAPVSVAQGKPALVTVTVTAVRQRDTAPSPTRSVTIVVGGVEYTAVLEAGVATLNLPTSGLTVGAHVVQVNYLGDRLYAPSQTSIKLTVRNAPKGAPVAS